jgi:multiple sugar transport system permease protein
MTTIAKSSTRSKQRSRMMRFWGDQRKWMPYLFLAPFFITFFVFQFYPLVRSVQMAFSESLGYAGTWEWVGFEHFVEAFTDRHLWTSFRNFIYFSVGSLITEVPVAILLATMLASTVLLFRGVFRTIFFIPSVLPGVLMGLVGLWFFSESRGLANAIVQALGGSRVLWATSPTYIMPMLLTIAFWMWMGYHAVFFLAGMAGIERSIIEASIVDGAGYWQRLRYITLPLLKPVLAYVTIIIALGSLTTYDIQAIVFASNSIGDSLSGPGGQGWFFIPYITELAFSYFRMGYATAIGWLVFFIAVGLTVLQLRLYKIGGSEE